MQITILNSVSFTDNNPTLPIGTEIYESFLDAKQRYDKVISQSMEKLKSSVPNNTEVILEEEHVENSSGVGRILLQDKNKLLDSVIVCQLSFIIANTIPTNQNFPLDLKSYDGAYILNSHGDYIDGPMDSNDARHEFDIHKETYAAYHIKEFSDEEARHQFSGYLDQ